MHVLMLIYAQARIYHCLDKAIVNRCQHIWTKIAVHPNAQIDFSELYFHIFTEDFAYLRFNMEDFGKWWTHYSGRMPANDQVIFASVAAAATNKQDNGAVRRSIGHRNKYTTLSAGVPNAIGK